MRWLCSFLCSSIGKKVQVAVAGLLLCGFLLTHLAGNLLLFKGPETFNHYAEALETNPALPAAEIVLLLLFLSHIVTAARVRWENNKARPVGYVETTAAGGRTWGSRTMAVSGTVVLAFLIVHVKTFRFGDREGGDLYRFVISEFQSVPYALFYIISMAAIGLHLSHGFQAGFRTLGLEHPKYTPLIVKGGLAFAAAISVGFAAIVVWAGWLTGGNP